MVKKLGKTARMESRAAIKRKKQEVADEEERILQKAAIYCLRTFPMLWTTGGIEKDEAPDAWIINVYVRYPTGFEGYLGDLHYDGETFRLITDLETMRERARKIEADPALKREWKEYLAATFPAKKG